MYPEKLLSSIAYMGFGLLILFQMKFQEGPLVLAQSLNDRADSIDQSIIIAPNTPSVPYPSFIKWSASDLPIFAYLIPLLIIIICGLSFWCIKLYRQKEKYSKSLKLLKANVNPHFMGNSLNAIEHLINTGAQKLASSYLLNFSRFYRQMLLSAEQDKIDLHTELIQIKRFLSLQQLRFRNTFDYEIKMENNLPVKQIVIPPMLLQSYLENAIWYGLKPKKTKGKLHLHFKITQKQLICEIQDNGIGRAAAQVIQNQSIISKIGMPNSKTLTQERLTVNHFNFRIEVLTEDLTDEHQNAIGTKITLKIPVEKKRSVNVKKA